MYNIVNFSGGKDSTALLLGCIERGIRVDMVLNCDTTMEFPQMYEHIEKVKENVMPYIGEWKTVKFDYRYYLIEHEYIGRGKHAEIPMKGFGWPFIYSRWCTGEKIKNMNKVLSYLNKNINYKNITCLIGIAKDETKRLERKYKDQYKYNISYPLLEWNMTEKDCLTYCYSKGFTWGGYINILIVFHVGVVLCNQKKICIHFINISLIYGMS